MGYSEALALMSKGRANPSDYLCRITFPAALTDLNASEFPDYISYFTRALTIPGLSHTMLNVSGQENVGISRNVPTGRSYGSPAVFTFTDRADLIIYNTLKRWMDLCFLNGNQEGINRNLRANYYNSITCTIDIVKLEPTGSPGIQTLAQGKHKPTGKWTLHNCVPVAIEQATLAMEAADALLDFTISTSFESYTYTPLNEANSSAYYDDYMMKSNGIPRFAGLANSITDELISLI